MSDEFDKFHKELKRMIQSEIKVAYPIIGVIVEISNDRQYCSVETDDGVINNIPAHGMPRVGDSAIIHFINGNYEQPVADCARRETSADYELEEMYSTMCSNYHKNGDFTDDLKGYTYDKNNPPKIVEDEDDTTGNNKYCMLDLNQYISFTCDISDCSKDVFKVQFQYRGRSLLEVKCEDADTNKVIKTLPVNTAKDSAIWGSESGRFTWVFNKEAYLKNDTNKIKVTITNVYDETQIPQMTFDDEKVDIPMFMSIDSILVYEENGDTEFSYNVNDII